MLENFTSSRVGIPRDHQGRRDRYIVSRALSLAVIPAMIGLLSVASQACTDSGAQSAGTQATAQEPTSTVDSADAIAECTEGVEPVAMGTWRDLPLIPEGSRVVVHAFESGLTYDHAGTTSFAALADVEICASDSLSLALDAPFTNRASFRLCQSETYEGETFTDAYEPNYMVELREPALPSAFEVAPGECRRGWLTFQTGQEEYPLQPHGVTYDTFDYTDTPKDQFRFAWTLP